MAKSRLTENGWVVEEGPEDRPRPEPGDHLRPRTATQDAAAAARIAELETEVAALKKQSGDVQRLADFILEHYPDIGTLHFDQAVDVAITLLAPKAANTEGIDDGADDGTEQSAADTAGAAGAAGDGTEQPAADLNNSSAKRSRK